LRAWFRISTVAKAFWDVGPDVFTILTVWTLISCWFCWHVLWFSDNCALGEVYFGVSISYILQFMGKIILRLK
jgi:hypothetical protein